MEALPQRSAVRTQPRPSPGHLIDLDATPATTRRAHTVEPLPRAPIYATALIAGFCMMSLEILAGPLLKPAFGSDNDVWTGIIAVFLGALSLGYTFGGHLADRMKTHLALGTVLLSSGLAFAATPLFSGPVISLVATTMPGHRMAALVASSVLFFLPILVLGMVTPMLVKMMFRGLDALGSTTGHIYTIAAIGNVGGVLLTNYVLIDYVGVVPMLYGMGAVLAITGGATLAFGRSVADVG